MSIHLIVLILHMLGAGLVVGIVLLALFAVIKPPVGEKSMDRLAFIARFGMWGSIWQFLTGLILASQEWGEFRTNRLFWTKIILYLIEGTIASLLLEKQSKQAALRVAGGQTIDGSALRLTSFIHAGLILAIAIIGVVLVSGGEE